MAGRGPKIILQGIVNIAATHKCYTIIKYPFQFLLHAVRDAHVNPPHTTLY